MKVYYGVGRFNRKFRRPILAIGIFDGIHRGHRYIIRKIVKKAKRIKGTSVVLTFYPHPYHVLKPREYLPLLISLEHRIKLLSDLGVDICIIQGFTEKFSKIDKIAFIKNLLFRKIHPEEIFVGINFTFGNKKAGNVKLMKELGKTYNYKIREIQPLNIDGETVSSTFIRKLILKGNLQKASQFSGRPVSIFGRIVKGSRRGKILGFPTANIDYDHEILPPRGVYAVRLILNKEKFLGVANIGFRPSFKKTNKQRKVVVEVHLFNFNKNIYGKNVEVEFIIKIRNERRFRTKPGLVAQIKKDLQNARQILKIRPK